MIGRLRRRMTLLVTMILILVTAGIIFSINYANWRQIVMQAEEILDRLAENNGKRPSRKSGEERKLPEIDVPPPEGTKGRQPPGLADTLVDLSNSYQITLSEDNEVTGWTSERADLYSDEQIEEFAAAALAESRSSGRIGTQFYRFLSEGKTRMLLVLDQRLEIMRARSVLRMSCAAAGIACLFKNQGTVGTQRHDDGPSGLPAEHVDGCIEGIGTGQLEGFVPVQVKDGMKRKKLRGPFAGNTDTPRSGGI